MTAATLTLAAPDFSAFDRAARRPDPAVLWPVGPQSLAAHWLDHAVRLGCQRVVMHVTDRPSAVRAALGGGAFWSLQIEISSQPSPAHATAMFGLPGQSAAVAPTNPVELLHWWFDLNTRWLAGRNRKSISIDRLGPRGGWLAPHVQIHPSATLVAPFWIGAETVIGPGCRIGPGALIGAGCVLEADVRLEQSLVLPGTCLGRHLDVCAKIVAGSTLLDWLTGTGLEIKDSFIATSLTPSRARVPWSERILAALLWLPAHALALGIDRDSPQTIRLPDGRRIALSTRSKGFLLGRRAEWLRHVIAGRLRLVGVLPRATPPDLPPECLRLLEGSTPGVFALSDLHGIHTANDAGEAVHALYQAADPSTHVLVRKNLFRLCRTQSASVPA